MKKTLLIIACMAFALSAQAESKYTASDNATYVQAINELKSSGLIVSMNEEFHKVVVEPSIWKTLTYAQKETMTSIIGAHFDYTSGYSSLTILDKYTNKKLAKFGVFGLKVY